MAVVDLFLYVCRKYNQVQTEKGRRRENDSSNRRVGEIIVKFSSTSRREGVILGLKVGKIEQVICFSFWEGELLITYLEYSDYGGGFFREVYLYIYVVL